MGWYMNFSQSDWVGAILIHQDQRCRRKGRGEELHFGLKVGESTLGSEFYVCMYSYILTVKSAWGQRELKIQERGWQLVTEFPEKRRQGTQRAGGHRENVL